MPLTPEGEEKSQAVLHVPRQSWTDQATNVAGAWAQLGVSQKEGSWKEKTAFILFQDSLPLNLLVVKVPVTAHN